MNTLMRLLMILVISFLMAFAGSKSMAQDISRDDQYRTMMDAPSFLLFIGGNQGIKVGSITTGFKDNMRHTINPYTGFSVAYYSSKPILLHFIFENEFGISKRGFRETEKVICADLNFFFKGRFNVKHSISPFALLGAMGYFPLNKTRDTQIQQYVRALGQAYYHYQMGGGAFVFGGGIDFGKPNFKYSEKIAGIEIRYGTIFNIHRKEFDPYVAYGTRKLYQDKEYCLTIVARCFIF
jgi:hypothetical protein